MSGTILLFPAEQFWTGPIGTLIRSFVATPSTKQTQNPYSMKLVLNLLGRRKTSGRNAWLPRMDILLHGEMHRSYLRPSFSRLCDF